ncbi:MAG: hypothetical protein NZ866_00355 [Patescibacteria group bacterium]|nr:hypothetical protein [Patescibacteria group bacterium]
MKITNNILIILFLLIFVFLFLAPLKIFAQPYFPFYQPPLETNQRNQSETINQVPFFVFASTGTNFAFIYPDLLGIMVSINGAINYGPFSQLLWYGFDSSGIRYGIVGVTPDQKYTVIVDGRRFEYNLLNTNQNNRSSPGGNNQGNQGNLPDNINNYIEMLRQLLQQRR